MSGSQKNKRLNIIFFSIDTLQNLTFLKTFNDVVIENLRTQWGVNCNDKLQQLADKEFAHRNTSLYNSVIHWVTCLQL